MIKSAKSLIWGDIETIVVITVGLIYKSNVDINIENFTIA